MRSLGSRSTLVRRTPDGRYIVVRGRLWRAANPDLDEAERDRLTRQLMSARRNIAAAQRNKDEDLLRSSRRQVASAKTALGERGPVWWTNGDPDYNRHLVKNTPYAEMFRETEANASPLERNRKRERH